MLITSFRDYAFIGLGSNLSSSFGSPQENIREAIVRLEKLSNEPLVLSSIIETRPVDCPPGSPDFANAVAALLPLPDETALNLLHELQRIENSMGRVRTGIKNEARIIDLDLLLFKDDVVSDDELVLPHPEMMNRGFVMQPLKEILEREALEELQHFAKKNSA